MAARASVALSAATPPPHAPAALRVTSDALESSVAPPSAAAPPPLPAQAVGAGRQERARAQSCRKTRQSRHRVVGDRDKLGAARSSIHAFDARNATPPLAASSGVAAHDGLRVEDEPRAPSSAHSDPPRGAPGLKGRARRDRRCARTRPQRAAAVRRRHRRAARVRRHRRRRADALTTVGAGVGGAVARSASASDVGA